VRTQLLSHKDMQQKLMATASKRIFSSTAASERAVSEDRVKHSPGVFLRTSVRITEAISKCPFDLVL